MSNTAGGALADYTPARPVIGVNSIGAITHGGRVCRVVLRRGLIQVGCTDVTIEAARELLRSLREANSKVVRMVLQ